MTETPQKHDTRRLWWLLKDSINNLTDLPTPEQTHALAWSFSLLELSFNGTVNVDKIMKDLIDARLNPLTNLEGIYDDL